MLISLDVDSLYTNIDNESGLSAVRNKLNQSHDTKVPKQYLLDLLKISLTKNDFEFNGEYFLQTWGTAMGKKLHLITPTSSWLNGKQKHWQNAHKNH